MTFLGRLAEPFPQPPDRVVEAVVQVQSAADREDAGEFELEEAVWLPRPWDPASCEPDVRYAVWTWVDEVAGWINSQHLWGITQPGIPECWPQHPHIAHDLVVVAFERYLSGFASSPASLAEWHRSTLPMFLERLHASLGSGCQPNRHTDSPRAERNRAFHARATSEVRRDAIEADATA